MGPSLSIVGSRSIVGVRVRKTLLASLTKVTGLAMRQELFLWASVRDN